MWWHAGFCKINAVSIHESKVSQCSTFGTFSWASSCFFSHVFLDTGRGFATGRGRRCTLCRRQLTSRRAQNPRSEACTVFLWDPLWWHAGLGNYRFSVHLGSSHWPKLVMYFIGIRCGGMLGSVNVVLIGFSVRFCLFSRRRKRSRNKPRTPMYTLSASARKPPVTKPSCQSLSRLWRYGVSYALSMCHDQAQRNMKCTAWGKRGGKLNAEFVEYRSLSMLWRHDILWTLSVCHVLSIKKKKKLWEESGSMRARSRGYKYEMHYMEKGEGG